MMRLSRYMLILAGIFGSVSHALAADICTDRFNDPNVHYKNATVDCILHWEVPQNPINFDGNTVFTQAGNEAGLTRIKPHQKADNGLYFNLLNGAGSVTLAPGSSLTNYGSFITSQGVHFIIQKEATFTNGASAQIKGPVDIYGTYVNGTTPSYNVISTISNDVTVHSGGAVHLAHESFQNNVKDFVMEKDSKLILDNGWLIVSGASNFLGDIELGTDTTNNSRVHDVAPFTPELYVNTQDPHPDHPQEIVFNGLKIRTGQLHLKTNAIVRLTQSVNVTEGGSIGIDSNQDVIFEKDLTISGEAKGVRQLNLPQTLNDGTKALLSYLGINTPSGHHKVVIKGKTTISDMAFAYFGAVTAYTNVNENKPQTTIELHDVDVLRNGALYASPEVQLRIKGALRIDQYNPERVYQVPAVWFWNRHNDLSTITTIDVSGGAQLYAAGIGPSQSGEAVINAPIRLQQGTLELGNIYAPNGDLTGPMTNDAVLAGAITATDNSTLKITSGHQLTLRGGDDKTPSLHFASGSSGKIYARQLKVAHGIEVQSGATLMLAGFDSKDKTQVAKDTDLVDVKAIKVDSGGTFYAFNTSRTNFGDIEVGSTPSDTKKSTFGTFFSTGDIHLGGALYAHGYAGDANQTPATINFNSNKISIDKGAGLIKATDGGHITVGKNSMETQMTIQAPLQVEARNPGTAIQLNTVGHSGNADYTMNADSQDAAWVYFLFKNAHTVSGLMNNHIDEGDQSGGGISLFVYAPDAGSSTRSVADGNADTPFLDWHPSATSSINKFACDQCSMLMPARQKPTDDIKVVTFTRHSKADDVTGKFTINTAHNAQGKPLHADSLSVLRIDSLDNAILLTPSEWQNVPVVYLKRPAPNQLPTLDLIKEIYSQVPDVVSGKLKLKYVDDHRYPNYVRVGLVGEDIINTPTQDFDPVSGWLQARYVALTPIEIISDKHTHHNAWARARYAHLRMNHHAFKAHIKGIQIGYNRPFQLSHGDEVRVGVKMDMEQQQSSFNPQGQSRDRIQRIGVFAVYSTADHKRLGLTLDYEHMKSQWQTPLLHATLRNKAWQVGVEGVMDYQLSPQTYLRPGVKLQWSHLRAVQAPVNQTSDTTSFQLYSKSTNAWQGLLEATFGHRYQLRSVPMDSWVRLGVVGDLQGRGYLHLDAPILSSRVYQHQSSHPQPYAKIGVGTHAYISSKLSLHADMQWLLGYYSETQATLRVQWQF